MFGLLSQSSVFSTVTLAVLIMAFVYFSMLIILGILLRIAYSYSCPGSHVGVAIQYAIYSNFIPEFILVPLLLPREIRAELSKAQAQAKSTTSRASTNNAVEGKNENTASQLSPGRTV